MVTWRWPVGTETCSERIKGNKVKIVGCDCGLYVYIYSVYIICLYRIIGNATGCIPQRLNIWVASQDLRFSELFLFWKVPAEINEPRCIVGIATGYGLDNWGVRVRFPVGSRMLNSPYHPDWLWSPLNLLSNWYWGIFPLGGKAAGHEADCSPRTSVEVKETWIYTFTPPYAFMVSA
jgi:hypothetical protein